MTCPRFPYHRFGTFPRFPSAKHFASWLGLSPGTKISGGKLLRGRTLPNADRAAQALRLAAAALRTSQSVLGADYRRMCARIDKAKAVTAASTSWRGRSTRC